MADRNVQSAIYEFEESYGKIRGGRTDVYDTAQGSKLGVRQMVANPTYLVTPADPNYAPSEAPPTGTGHILPDFSFFTQGEFDDWMRKLASDGKTEDELKAIYVGNGYVGTTAITDTMIENALA